MITHSSCTPYPQIWNNGEEQSILLEISTTSISNINISLISITCRDIGNICEVRNTFYNQELRIVSQKRSWNKELKFGTRNGKGISARTFQTDDVGTTIDLGIYTTSAQYITECNVESATNQ